MSKIRAKYATRREMRVKCFEQGLDFVEHPYRIRPQRPVW